ncbi:MAG: beta-carotene 15,15'-dioxygenase, Brp/Blh family [Burkholderiales bacterium]|nr:beta-carotene 15,15'-dioxygenase, Brp/Blh family [Bacteroidia bacterium]
MKKEKCINYDYAFIGLGAGNSLILLSLIQKGLHSNKKIIVFETESKNINDKTFCFWSRPNESIVADLSPIISHRFNAIKVNQSFPQKIDLQPYHYIRSIDLYNHTHQILTKEEIKINRTAVNQISLENKIYTIHTNCETFKTNFIFDSRPPKLIVTDKKQIYLDQSFYGLHIKCEKDVFIESTFEMMNFNVDQNNYTQFVYVIPFSTNEALVELTRFGKDKIDKTYALGVLNNFISRDFGKFKILAYESGCIPMTSYINPPNTSDGILHTGASANLIKPSTGYGFKKMHAFAKLVIERIESNKLEKFNKIKLNSKNRFKFYDKLLLLILIYWPSKGKLIFTRLFEKQSIITVFSFLDEKTSFLQELRIFASLPILVFLKAFYLHVKRENWLRYIFSFLIVTTYLFLSNRNHQLAGYYIYLVLIAGLLLIGIPHGALDHMLSKSRNTSLFLFVSKYLIIIILYFIFWQFFPFISLIVFMIYSSFHFGETELIETEKKIDSVGSHFKAFLMGLSILIFIIFTHREESFNIIGYFIKTQELKYANFNNISWSISIVSFIYLLIQSVLSKRWSYIGLIFLLLLGIKVPLILAFGIYFIFQHSSNAWQHLKVGLNMNSIQLYKKSSIYTLGALFIFILIGLSANEIININGLIANLFISIACISLPHFFFMHIFYKSKVQ